MSYSEEQFLALKEKIESSPFAKSNITRSKKQGLAYLHYRILRPFYKLRYLNFQKKNPSLPWLTPDAIMLLKSMLTGGKGLEFGSGRSTLFFAKLLDQLVSVEHHEGWYKKVNSMIAEKGIKNTQLHLVRANQEFSLPALSSEEQVFMTKEEYPLNDDIFSDYVNILDQFEDRSIDFILVDGRARNACAMKAESKLKSGGLLVLDNSERARYQMVHHQFKHYPSITTTTGLTDTTIWFKV